MGPDPTAEVNLQDRGRIALGLSCGAFTPGRNGGRPKGFSVPPAAQEAELW